eukprot:11213701-Lingulodinium_polyedra.AAC.1
MHVEKWYLQVPEDELADLWPRASRCSGAAFAEATRFHRTMTFQRGSSLRTTQGPCARAADAPATAA